MFSIYEVFMWYWFWKSVFIKKKIIYMHQFLKLLNCTWHQHVISLLLCDSSVFYFMDLNNTEKLFKHPNFYIIGLNLLLYIWNILPWLILQNLSEFFAFNALQPSTLFWPFSLVWFKCHRWVFWGWNVNVANKF